MSATPPVDAEMTSGADNPGIATTTERTSTCGDEPTAMSAWPNAMRLKRDVRTVLSDMSRKAFGGAIPTMRR